MKTKTFKIGDKVKLTKNYKQWKVKHFCELNQVSGSIPVLHDITMQISLLTDAVESTGKIIGDENYRDIFRVQWKNKFGQWSEHYGQKDLEKV